MVLRARAFAGSQVNEVQHSWHFWSGPAAVALAWAKLTSNYYYYLYYYNIIRNNVINIIIIYTRLDKLVSFGVRYQVYRVCVWDVSSFDGHKYCYAFICIMRSLGHNFIDAPNPAEKLASHFYL